MHFNPPDEELQFQLSAIKYSEESGPPPDWDDRMAVVKMVPEDQLPPPPEAAAPAEFGGKNKKPAGKGSLCFFFSI